jgi:tRNA threonylcarbamoyladenosine biosynthesis protein TsaE
LYRLSEVGSDFDLEDYIDSDDIVVIEWPFQVDELLPNEYLLIKIEKLDDNTRVFHFDSHLLDEEVLDNL